MTQDTISTRVVQRRPVLGDVAANAETVETALRAAAQDGIDLLVFPELFLTGYHIGRLETEQVVAAAEEAVAELTTVAPEVTAVIGTPLTEGGRLYNSAVVLENGAQKSVYHKTHLYDKEGTVFEAGSDFPVVETNAGTLGVQICYDVEFPEVSRQLALAGAEVLVTVSANMRPFVHDQTTYHAARALENIRPHVLCNRIGTEHGVEFFGKSGIVDERGRPVVMAGEDAAIELTGTVELAGDGEETLQYLADRRPSIYDG